VSIPAFSFVGEVWTAGSSDRVIAFTFNCRFTEVVERKWSGEKGSLVVSEERGAMEKLFTQLRGWRQPIKNTIRSDLGKLGNQGEKQEPAQKKVCGRLSWESDEVNKLSQL